MENADGQPWKVTKEKLIREIESTYEAILKFKKYQVKTVAELSELTVDELHAELLEQSKILEKLVSDWDFD